MTPHQYSRMLAAAAVFATLAVLIFSACSDRQRLNPLDPENPETLGAPPAPFIAAFGDSIRLVLPQLQLDDGFQYRVYRAITADSAARPIADIAAGTRLFWDVTNQFDQQHVYSLSIFSNGYESPQSEAISIRPGPTFLWALDASEGQVTKYTHDGSRELFRSRIFFQPVKLDIDSQRGTVWVADRFGSQVYALDKQAQTTGNVLNVDGISTIAVDTADHSIWALSAEEGRLLRFDEGGRRMLDATGFASPSAISLIPAGKQALVLEADSNRVVLVDTAATILQTFSGFAEARDLVYHQNTGMIWVAQETRITIFSLQQPEARKEYAGFESLSRIIASEGDGVWVADLRQPTGNARVVKLSANGTQLFQLAGLIEPRALALNPFNQHCIIGDRLGREIIELSADGETVGRFENRGRVQDLAIEFSR